MAQTSTDRARLWHWILHPDPQLLRRRLIGLVIVMTMVNLTMFSTNWLDRNYRLFYEKYTEGCLPYSFYAVERRPAIVIQHGDVVMFTAHRMEPVLPDGSRIGKLVIGVPGDQVNVTHGRLYVNGRYWGSTKLGAQKFAKLPSSWDKSYVLKQDEFFVFGSEPRSWDSRFWGPVKRDEIIALAHPLF